MTGPAGVTQAAWVVHEGMCAKPWKMVMWGGHLGGQRKSGKNQGEIERKGKEASCGWIFLKTLFHFNSAGLPLS